jgi:hypothetical protein
MTSTVRIALFAIPLFLLTGCLYDSAPSGPVRSIDTWLVGQWETTDASGNISTATVAPAGTGLYAITFSGKNGRQMEHFDGWLSRVDDFSILVLKALDGENTGKHLLFHHELLSPTPAPPGGAGATRVRISELQLDASSQSLDPYNLRKVIRTALKHGDLLAPYDVVADRKTGGSKTPGSVIWTKTGGVTMSGETF